MEDSIDHFTGNECLTLAAVQNERAERRVGGGRPGEEGQADQITKLVSQVRSLSLTHKQGGLRGELSLLSAAIACAHAYTHVSGQAGATASVWMLQDTFGE